MFIFGVTVKGGVFKSIGGMGAVMTNMVLRSGGDPTHGAPTPKKATLSVKDVVNQATQGRIKEVEDVMVMDTKLKIIEILQVIHRGVLRFSMPDLTIFGVI